MRGPVVAVAGLLAVAVLVPGLAGATGAAGPEPGGGSVAADGIGTTVSPASTDLSGVESVDGTQETGIVQRMTYRLDPANESSVALHVEYEAGSNVDGLVLYPPSRATLVSATAFERQDRGHFFTSEDFDNASATFRIDLPEETVDDHWGQGVATREWAVAGGMPGTGFYDGDAGEWSYEDSDAVARELTVEGEGLAGSRSVVLGEHAVHERDVEGQRIRLVAVAGHDTVRPPAEILDALAYTASSLEVGPRDESVMVVAIPVRSRAVTGTVFSERVGQQDIWLYRAGWGIENTWIHEYVHTRQTYEPAEDMEWFAEASANYYEKLFALRAGAGSYAEFRDRVGNRSAGGVLADRSTWQQGTQYVRGQRVLAALDARIQRATDYERSLADVFRLVNEHEGSVTLADFTAYVSTVAGEAMDEWIQSHVAGSADVSFADDPYAYTAPSGEEDPDGDGLTDAAERDLGSHPFRPDTDGDGLDDAREADLGTDPTAADTDGDGLPDGREADLGTDPATDDTDGDGLGDGAEVDEYDTDPTTADTDGDGLDDAREADLGSDPSVGDTDSDDLSDGDEVDNGTDPTTADTDDDGLTDGRELGLETDPTASDTDDDGLSDGAEVEDHETDPVRADTDDDGLDDGREVELGTDPRDYDTDRDGLEDGREVDLGTDPTAADTDGDGYSDEREVSVGTDPTESTGRAAFLWARATGAVSLPVAGFVVALVLFGVSSAAVYSRQ